MELTNMSVYLVRVYHPDFGARLCARLDDAIYDISDYYRSTGAWLRTSSGRASEAVQELVALALQEGQLFNAATFDQAPGPDHPHWLAPIEEQDVWAAGVTYERSREARQEEATDGGDVYARVYSAERPEIFFKAHGRAVVGSYGEVGIRKDAAWSVPEPELVIVVNPALEIVGFSVGNDMSSRDIEGANPLYLPQAKVYTASCAMGPGILLQPSKEWPAATIHLKIDRDGKTAFTGEISTARIKRRADELVSYLGRSNEFPDGVALLTGTGIVPPSDFTLAAGDVVMISIDGIGTLVNTVKVV
jgi:2-dehydro-3-deoxy-D-arabinonate dehydratase